MEKKSNGLSTAFFSKVLLRKMLNKARKSELKLSRNTPERNGNGSAAKLKQRSQKQSVAFLHHSRIRVDYTKTG